MRPRTAAVLLLVVAVVQTQGAHASSSLTTASTKDASATFDTYVGDVRTSVDVVVSETEVTSPEGSQRGLHADIEILQFDPRIGTYGRMIDVAGGVDTQAGGFDLRQDLSNASLDLTIAVCGAKVLHNGRLKQRAFRDCFDLRVDLQWTGTGEIVSDSGTDDYPAGDCTVHVISSYSRRASLVTGTISAGAINFTPGDSMTSSIAITSRSTAATCPD